MSKESAGPKKKTTAVLIAGIVSLWPLYYILVVFALMKWGWSEGEFSLATRDVSTNRIIFLVAIGATLALSIGVIVCGLRAFVRRLAGRGRALAGVIMASASTLIIVTVVILVGVFFGFGNLFGGKGGDKLSAEDRINKCRSNQEKIAVMLGPEMYGFDHPDVRPEELKELDLSPSGDLVNPEDGPAYTTDPTIFDCPADDDPNDVDYVVDVTPNGEIKVRCIDPEGMEEGHNK
ncbi:MAG: hypothetical protein PVH29_10580 [Candidatus Zixiibacteriota bacterium]|jgi:hypothetical protein